MHGQQIFDITKQNTKYGYASGRIRVLETRLLSKSDVARLVEAESTEEVLSMLSDGSYGVVLTDIREPADFETAMSAEIERTYALIDELSHDPELTQMFRARGDFHNLKVLLKAKNLEGSDSNFDDILVRFGLIPIDDIKSFVEIGSDSREGKIPDYIANALKDAQAKYEETQNPQMIDIVIDNHLHSFMYNCSADYPNPFLRGYFSAAADLNNIRNFIRIKMLGENLKMLDAVLLPYGVLDKKIFLQQFDETLENFVADLVASDLVRTPYVDLIAEGTKGWEEEYSLAVLEKLIDDYLINYIKPAKYIIFGVEPLIGYLLAKENEIKLIRIIMIGKLNHLPAEIINERLRDTYV